MKKVLSLLMVILLVTLLLVPFTEGKAKTITYRLPHTAAAGGHFDLIAHKFVDELERLSEGRLKGTVYPAEQLGPETQVIQNVQANVIEFTIIGHDPLAQFSPNTMLLSLPFLFANHEQAFAVLDSEVGEQLEAELLQRNLRVLGWSNNGARVYTNNTRPLTKPADFVGLKFRSPESPINLAVTRSLGGVPSGIPYGEVYTAIQQKTIDGQENAVINIYPSKLYEVQKYMSMTNHILSFVVIVGSEGFYRKLPAADRALVDQAAAVAAEWHRNYVDGLTAELTQKMIEHGVEVNYIDDLTPFQKATASVHAEYVGKVIDQSLYNKTLEILANLAK